MMGIQAFFCSLCPLAFSLTRLLLSPRPRRERRGSRDEAASLIEEAQEKPGESVRVARERERAKKVPKVMGVFFFIFRFLSSDLCRFFFHRRKREFFNAPTPPPLEPARRRCCCCFFGAGGSGDATPLLCCCCCASRINRKEMRRAARSSLLFFDVDDGDKAHAAAGAPSSPRLRRRLRLRLFFLRFLLPFRRHGQGSQEGREEARETAEEGAKGE